MHGENKILNYLSPGISLYWRKVEGTLNKIVFNNMVKDYVIGYKHTDHVVKQMEVCDKKSRKGL